MLIKRIRKNIADKKKLNFLNKVFLYFKNFSFIVVLLQLFVLSLIIIFYQSSQLSKSYPPKTILNRINIEQKKATGFDFKNIKSYIAVGLKGLKTKITGNKLDLISLSIDQKNILLIKN